MAVRNKLLLATWLLLGAAGWGQYANAPAQHSAPPAKYGAIGGRVLDSRGVAQTGVPVTITRQDGLVIRQVYTGPNGRFDLSRLLPGLYAIDVSLPNFLPFSKAPILVQAGGHVALDVSLRTLAESLEIGVPRDPAEAREDWKWALRTASPARPILRFQEEMEAGRRSDTPKGERPVRGTVLVSAGNDSRSFGAGPGLRTIFNMEYSWTGGNAVRLAGSGGWERGTPAASVRTAWNHRSDNGSNSALSVTMRQLLLPNAYREQFSLPSFSFGHRVQSFSGGYENETPLSSNLRMRYGATFDNVSVRRTVSQWSPFAQLSYSPSEQTRWTFTFTAESPRVLPSTGAPGQGEESLAIPQISSDVTKSNRAALETGKHVEAGWERQLGHRYLLQAAAFYDSMSDMAVSIAGPDGSLPAGLLRDPFSATRFLDAGDYSSTGARAAFGARLSDNSKLIVSYSYAGALRAVSHTLTAETEDSRSLRDMIRTQRASSVTVAIHSVVPRSGTQVLTSYEWLPHNSVVAGDPYSSGLGRSEPYLNLELVQPLPSPDILPGQFQAIADFSNLLAQGYVPIHKPEHSTSYFFPSARSFRGGFNFIF